MTTAIARTANGNGHVAPAAMQTQISKEQIELVKRTVAQNATDDELQMFLSYCKAQNVSPLSKQIHFLKFGNTVNFVSSYHHMLGKVQSSGMYEGMTTALYCDESGKWSEIWTSQQPPLACKIGVYRHGYRDAQYTIKYYAEVAQNTSNWKRQPLQMLRKCAIADALRLAFDDILQGIYIQEEMPETAPHQNNVSSPKMSENWQFEDVPNELLPLELKDQGITYERIANDESLVYTNSKGTSCKARSLLHIWQTSKSFDERTKAFATKLLDLYPSKSKSTEDIPPENVTTGM